MAQNEKIWTIVILSPSFKFIYILSLKQHHIEKEIANLKSSNQIHLLIAIIWIFAVIVLTI